MVSSDRDDAVKEISRPRADFLARLVELKLATGLSCRNLEDPVRYSKSTISEKLTGRTRLDWDFVHYFVTACTARLGIECDLNAWRAEFDRMNRETWLANCRRHYLADTHVVDSPPPGRRGSVSVYYTGLPDLDTRLIRYGQAVVDWLISHWHGQSACAVLASPAGVVCTRRGTDRELDRRLERHHLAPGFSYAEEHALTNGIGTAAATGRTAYVVGEGHQAEELRDDACAAAVVRDPATNAIAGIVNLTCRLRDANPLLVTIAETTAQQIGTLLGEDRRIPAG
jgi:hypothetical protein